MRNSQFIQEFNSNSNYLKHFALKLTRDKNAADDLFQETALKAFKYKKKFMEQTNFKAWLSTIMKNSFINDYRKWKRRNEIQDQTEDSYFLNSHEGVVTNEGEVNMNMKEILKLVDGLKEDYRVPFLMAYEGYKYEEIQKEMNIPLGSIKSRIHQARKILKEQIRKNYEEDLIPMSN